MHKRILFILISLSIHLSFGQNIAKIQKELKENPKARIQNAAALRKYYSDYATDSLFPLATFLIQKGIEEDNLPDLMYGKLILSSYYNVTGKTESSIQNLKDCINYYQKRGDIERLADAQNLLGIAYIYAGEYQNAANSFVKSIKNSEKLDIKSESFIAQLNLSEVYIREDKLDLAEAEVLTFIEKCKKIKARNGLKKGYDFLAKINMQRNNMDLTIYYYEKALKLAMQDSSYIIRSSAYNNIAIAHFETGKLDLSYEYFKKALELRIKLNRPKEISESYYNLGDWYFYQDNFEEAQKYYQLSLKVAEKSQLQREIADALDKISMCFESKGDYKNALLFAQKYQTVEAKIYKRNQKNEIDRQRIVYEMEREEQILKQKKREDKIQNKVSVEKGRGKIIVISFSIIVALMITFYFLQNTKRNRESASIISEKVYAETLSKLNETEQKWKKLENFISTHENTIVNTQSIENDFNQFKIIGNFQFLKLVNGNYLLWETSLSKLENYIIKDFLINHIGTEVEEQKILELLESHQLIDHIELTIGFVQTSEKRFRLKGKNGLLIQNSNKMSLLNENETKISQLTILISERLKNELLNSEHWDHFLEQTDMISKMSNKMAIDTIQSCWSDLLEAHQLGMVVFSQNEA